jgi:signal peptidase
MTRSLTIVRRALLVTWLALIGAVLSLVVLTHVANPLGYRVVIIRGASMTPTIPLGSLAFEQPVAAAKIRVGDVVTLTLPQGAIVTHRVTRLASIDGVPYIETKGDANADVDSAIQPASSVTGVVRFHAPVVGFVLAFLGVPSGILSVISMLGSLLAAIWLLEELDADRRAAAAAPDLLGQGVAA